MRKAAVVRYFVHVECVPAAGTPPLDALQRAGASDLLGGTLERLAGVDGPDGVVIELEHRWVATHPEGAKLLLAVDAPTLELAESGARAMAEEVLEAVEGFEGWLVASCEVKLQEDAAHQSLAAADGPGAVPADIGERVRRMRSQHAAGRAVPLDPEEADERRAVLRALAGRLSVDLSAFGLSADSTDKASREAAELAAGALVYAIDLLSDDLFDDLVELEADREAESVTDSERAFMVLEQLPPAYADQYTPLFVRKFVVATAMLTARLTSPSWAGLLTTAEELALRLLIEEAIPALDLHGLYDDATEEAFAAFKDTVYEDSDHEDLYDTDPDEELVDPDTWFEPFRASTRVHPYTLD